MRFHCASPPDCAKCAHLECLNLGVQSIFGSQNDCKVPLIDTQQAPIRNEVVQNLDRTAAKLYAPHQ